jgi:hypothetical protein
MDERTLVQLKLNYLLIISKLLITHFISTYKNLPLTE